jgi:hypothetical protein
MPTLRTHLIPIVPSTSSHTLCSTLVCASMRNCAVSSRLGTCPTLSNLEFSSLTNGVGHAASHHHGPSERSTQQRVKAVVTKQCHSSREMSFYEFKYSDTCGVTDIELPSKWSREGLCVAALAGRVSCKRLVTESCASRLCLARLSHPCFAQPFLLGLSQHEYVETDSQGHFAAGSSTQSAHTWRADAF